MKKTVSISLAGYAFIIEEDAFLKLSNYISALKKPLNADEMDEVIHDIELRMVEILTERLKNRTVVNVEDVDVLISHIGSPENFEDFDEKKSHQANQFTDKKQLYRDSERKKIAGVCSGLAYYFGVDVVIVRIIFLLLLLGTGFGFLMYLVLWIAVPKAETTSDILKMKGKPVNFENIKDYSSQIAKEAYESANNMYANNKSTLVRIGQAFVRVFSIIVGVVASLMAFSFLLVSFAFLFGDITINQASYSMPENLDFYLGNGSLSKVIVIFVFASFFFTALYFLLLAVRCFYTSLKSIFLKTTFLMALCAWLTLSVLLVVGFSKTIKNYDGKNKTVETKAIVPVNDTIRLSLREMAIPEGYKSYLGGIYSNKHEIFESATKNVVVVKDKTIQSPYIQIETYGAGEHIPLDIKLPVEVKENQIYLPSKYVFQYNNRWRNYKIKYTVFVPSNVTLIADDELKLFYRTDEVKINQDGLEISDDIDEEDLSRNKIVKEIKINAVID